MDEGGFSSNNLHYCALYKLLFHRYHCNIWLPASNTSNNVAKIGHVQFILSNLLSREKADCVSLCFMWTHLCATILDKSSKNNRKAHIDGATQVITSCKKN